MLEYAYSVHAKVFIVECLISQRHCCGYDLSAVIGSCCLNSRYSLTWVSDGISYVSYSQSVGII